ncbi:MAG: hypothetical protein OEV99_01275 [Nitrospira sp.]|nr:hypothetical protein [Nitrospira sp.]MDH5348228.1 hypothetical protein [Nitrospira sp.]MDH5498950.1 hypothetical protein [Nitrospira sp.]MDH5725910.1 hypothetical protein [Nitrospira sp.]
MNRFLQPFRIILWLFLVGVVNGCTAELGLTEVATPQTLGETAPAQVEASPEPHQLPPESEQPGQPDASSELQPPLESEIPDYAEESAEPDSSILLEEEAAEHEPEVSTPEPEANPSIMLTGRVWRAKPGIVFLKTPVGLLSLSSKTTLRTIPASQEISFVIHDDHLVVDIVKRTDGTLVHRYLSGPFKQSEDDTQLIGWTPEGEQAFHMGNHARALSNRKDGESITVEVDTTNTVIGVHDLQFDLQVGQIGTRGSAAHLLLTGTISKLKSNFIFFRTPIGIVNVNAKIGIKNAKVGQTMTLRMHDHHVVADLSASSDSAPNRRFVTGPLEFATPDRASVRLWTPEGEQTYPTDLAKGTLKGVKEGTPITVELNGQGDVVEFHRMK